MSNPLVSIIMPAFNADKYLEESIQSVLKQTYSYWELLISDDASTDRTKEIIEKYTSKDSRIKSIYLERNSGTATTRNIAIKNSNGKYIAFLDADDQWKENKLEVQISFMQSHSHAFTFSFYEVIDEKGNLKNKLIKCPEEVTYRQLLKTNTIGCLTVIYDSEQLGKMYMPDIRKRQDYGLWLDILKKGVSGYGIQQTLAYYREGSASLSSNKFSVLKYNWQILRKYQKLDIFSSVYYYSFFLLRKTLKYFS